MVAYGRVGTADSPNVLDARESQPTAGPPLWNAESSIPLNGEIGGVSGFSNLCEFGRANSAANGEIAASGGIVRANDSPKVVQCREG